MRVVVVGGGLTGLTAAWRLREDAEVVLLEAADEVGGQVRTVELGGAALDVGADAMLARHPEGIGLARELGLGEELVEPAAGPVWLWVGGRLRRLPAGTVMGVPTDPVALARSGVLEPRAVLRAAAEPLLPRRGAPGSDRAVGDLVTERYGRAVTDLLVEPLLSGVYAGSIDRLSAAATAPMLWRAAVEHRRMTAGLRAQRRGAVDTGPVFMTLRRGLGTLVRALASDLGARVRTSTPALGLRAHHGGWTVETPTEALEADRVVVAVPAAPAARLVATAAPGLARALEAFDTASVAVVALAYDHTDVAGLPSGSGLLVPRREGRLVKAATWSSRKWPHLASADRFLLRASVGRVDDPRGLELDDGELASRVDEEVRLATGIRAGARERRVVRWDAAMPQYDVGHLDRVARVREELAAAPAGLAVGGAALDGVGLPARVRDGQRLADEIRRQSVTSPGSRS